MKRLKWRGFNINWISHVIGSTIFASQILYSETHTLILDAQCSHTYLFYLCLPFPCAFNENIYAMFLHRLVKDVNFVCRLVFFLSHLFLSVPSLSSFSISLPLSLPLHSNIFSLPLYAILFQTNHIYINCKQINVAVTNHCNFPSSNQIALIFASKIYNVEFIPLATFLLHRFN